MILGISIQYALLDFFVFSFLGWIYESTFVSVRSKKLVNRGFLMGPVIPLYGFGAVLVYLLLRPFAKIPSILYLMGMLIATVIEYVTAWLLEIAFHTKWWDYSNEPYNLKGRVALIPSMFWGILSLFLFDFLQPAADAVIRLIPEKAVRPFLAAAIFLLLCDLVYTVITTINFRKQLVRLYDLKKELEYLLDELQEASLREILSAGRKEREEKPVQSELSAWAETFAGKLKSLRGKSEDSALNTLEERFRLYLEHRSSVLKKRPLIGNQRLLDAFPNMKLLSGKHADVEVRDLLMNIRKKKK
ncbi:MAG: putative ABC transporter permease [Clostridiaceae bacterium]|nr:putative ABC transporter permease [Clostridiaceae bacterium]